MGLTYDSVAKAEKALVKLGFLGRGEDENGPYWKPKDPDPMNLWSVQRAEYIPSSDENHAELCMGGPSEGSMETIRGQHGNHPSSARVESGKRAASGFSVGGEELGEEKVEEITQEPRPREVEPPPARENTDLSTPPPREPTPTPAPKLLCKPGTCTGCNHPAQLYRYGYSEDDLLCKFCRPLHSIAPPEQPKPPEPDTPKPKPEPNSQAAVDAAMAEFEALRAKMA
jgi:hypothetical protein